MTGKLRSGGYSGYGGENKMHLDLVADAGDFVDNIIPEALRISNYLNISIWLHGNGIELLIMPGEKPDTVRRRYNYNIDMEEK
jgi:hypothetical protein